MGEFGSRLCAAAEAARAELADDEPAGDDEGSREECGGYERGWIDFIC